MGPAGKRTKRLERESELEIPSVPEYPMEKFTMSQTQILILITALATTTAFGISYLAKLGFFEKAVQVKQAQQDTTAPGNR